jgi:hypothetical protein
MLLALLLHLLHHSHFLSPHLVDFSFKCFDLQLALVAFLHHSVLLSVFLLRIFQLVFELFDLLFVDVVQLCLLLLRVSLAECFRSLLLKLSYINLIALNLLVVLHFHCLQQVVLEHLMGLFNGIEKLFLVLKV